MNQAVDEVELRERRVSSRSESAQPMANITFAMWGAALLFVLNAQVLGEVTGISERFDAPLINARPGHFNGT